MSLSPREMLARLVAFPSVSTSSNLDIIGFCREWLQSHGVESRLVMSPEGDKANLYATIGPQVEGGIVLSGHTDVVPVEGQAWTTDPWTLDGEERPPLRPRYGRHERLRRARPGAGARDGAGAAEAAGPHRPVLRRGDRLPGRALDGARDGRVRSRRHPP